MMYRLKNIVTYDDEIELPKCMYCIKNPIEILKADDTSINISAQVIKFLKGPNKKMAELEQRQDQLLKKLDILYDKIKSISSICGVNTTSTTQGSRTKEVKQAISTPEEIVVDLKPDSLPWYLIYLLKEVPPGTVNVSWHIHSSVPNEKVAKIKAFVGQLKFTTNGSKANLRLIFKCSSADSELKLSSLTVPIVGHVNILRYLSYVYPNIFIYPTDYCIDHLLDLCHVLERTAEKNRAALIKEIFSQYKTWVYKDEFSIVDMAVYNIVKQWPDSARSKLVQKPWFEKCQKKFL